jgi:radical SAM superfamily enzyme
MVSSKKKWTVMNPIRRQMKKHNPSNGQNNQLVHWWLLIHYGRLNLS